MLATAPGKMADLGSGIIDGFNRDMAISIAKCDEIALGIDNDLLNLARASLKQAAQQVRFAGARISLDQKWVASSSSRSTYAGPPEPSNPYQPEVSSMPAWSK